MKIWAGGEAICLAVVLISLSAFSAEAARIRVSQESRPGAGDFGRHILGHIDAYASRETTAAQYYGYAQIANASYNGPSPRLRADTSHLFFVRTKEGLSLFIVHDKPNDQDGGTASMTMDLSGDPNGAHILVQDDPWSPNDQYLAAKNRKRFQTWHGWYPCCTDGLVMGAFEGDWKVLLQFTSTDNDPEHEAFSGLTAWTAFSADGSKVSLKLESGRRVRLEPIGALVRNIRPAWRTTVSRLGRAENHEAFRPAPLWKRIRKPRPPIQKRRKGRTVRSRPPVLE